MAVGPAGGAEISVSREVEVGYRMVEIPRKRPATVGD